MVVVQVRVFDVVLRDVDVLLTLDIVVPVAVDVVVGRPCLKMKPSVQEMTKASTGPVMFPILHGGSWLPKDTVVPEILYLMSPSTWPFTSTTPEHPVCLNVQELPSRTA